MTDEPNTEPEADTDDGPPCDGTGGVNTDDERGHWVRRIEYVPPHQCMPPTRASGYGYARANAEAGELWRCNCGRLWECYIRLPNTRGGQVEAGGTRRREWRPAGLWLMLRYARFWEALPPVLWVGFALAAVVLLTLMILAALGVYIP